MSGRVILTAKGEGITAHVIEDGDGFDVVARVGPVEGVAARCGGAVEARALARGLVQVGALEGFHAWLTGRPGMGKAF